MIEILNRILMNENLHIGQQKPRLLQTANAQFFALLPNIKVPWALLHT